MSKKAQKEKTTEHDDFDFSALLNAIKSIAINNVSIRKAAAANGIPDRSLTRYKKKFDVKVKDIKAYNDKELLGILHGIASYKNVSAAQMVYFLSTCFCFCVLNSL